MTFKQEATEQLASLNQKAVETSDLQTRSNWTTCLTQSKGCWNKWPSNKKQLNNLPHSIKRLLKQVTFKQEATDQPVSLNQVKAVKTSDFQKKQSLNQLKAIETSDLQTRSNWTTCLTQSKGCWNKWPSNKKQLNNLPYSIKRLLQHMTFKQEATEQLASLNQKADETSDFQTRSNWTTCLTQSKGWWNKWPSNKKQLNNLPHSIKRLLQHVTLNKKQLNNLPHSIKRLLKQVTFKKEAIEQLASLNQKAVETSDLQTRGNWPTCFTQSSKGC